MAIIDYFQLLIRQSKMKSILTLLGISSVIVINSKPVKAITTTLYDGSNQPEFQGWLAPGGINSDGSFKTYPDDIAPLQTVDGTTAAFSLQTQDIDSSSNSIIKGYLGYSNHTVNPLDLSQLQLVNSSFPTLDADEGYSVFFDVALDETTDSDDDRAAFSVIAISSDATKGIELDFDANRIFAQSAEIVNGFSEFTRAETTTGTFDTTVSNSYELKINSSTYELFANNTSILTGDLKEYKYDTDRTDPPLSFNPYETENLLFFGDLTDQASGKFTLGQVSVDTASVPFNFSPTLGLALVGIGVTARKLYKNQKNQL